MTKFAAIQMASGPQVAANLTEAGRLIGMAARSGAGLVVLPENFALMPMREEDRVHSAEANGDGPIQAFLSTQARMHNVSLVGGTIPLRANDRVRVRAACLVYDAQGECIGRYDKIHLFDVRLANGEAYEESRGIEAGSDPVVVSTAFGKMGLAVCYDLRFPELFRKLLDAGAEFIAVPSAFTAQTGRAHWEPLVRARAIENLCYVIAANQGGYHVNGRETHGDSMIVSSWGDVLDRLPRGSGVVLAEFDADYQRRTRTNLPSIEHRRLNHG